MANIFIISDTHFGHANILNFEDSLGAKIRPFSCAEEMDECMVERWNSVVRTQDKVYHLGDVTMGKDLGILSRLRGHKRLVRGNHDDAPVRAYLEYFDEVYASRVLDKIVLTHIPIHPESLGRFKANIHGHIHQQPSFGAHYFNVSVEAIDYTPLSLEDIKLRIAKRE